MDNDELIIPLSIIEPSMVCVFEHKTSDLIDDYWIIVIYIFRSVICHYMSFIVSENVLLIKKRIILELTYFDIAILYI